MQQRTRNFPCRRNPPSELSEADAADHPSVSNVVHIAKHADTRFCICRGIMTSPVRHRRIFKCCIIISYFPEKSKRSARFFRIFSRYGKNRSTPAAIFDSGAKKTADSPERAAAFFRLIGWQKRRLCLLRRTHGTCVCTSTAVEAGVCVDHILAVALGNCACRAGLCTSTALDAGITDCICHNCYLL